MWLVIGAIFAAWVGHAYLVTAVLNFAYARPLPKTILRPWRLLTGLVIVGFPGIVWAGFDFTFFDFVSGSSQLLKQPLGPWIAGYFAVCLVFGVVVFPAVTVYRLFRRPVPALVAESTHTLDVRAELGERAIGEGKWVRSARLPINDIFRVDFTDLTLAIPNLPPAWDGLTVLLLSDLHFHSTPSRAFFERVLQEIKSRWGASDLVCLAGDIVDADTRIDWIRPLLGRLTAREAKLAILGNHDQHHHPERIRAELTAAGFTVLSNHADEPTAGPRVLAIRGIPYAVIGHEGPWFRPDPKLTELPDTPFRLCLSHTPDYFSWGRTNRINLMLCGHVHGGQIRLPVIGSIFVPSMYGRRFDMGVFERGGTVMVVGRGLSGKEPLRFRCHPQVIRLTLKPR